MLFIYNFNIFIIDAKSLFQGRSIKCMYVKCMYVFFCFFITFFFFFFLILIFCQGSGWVPGGFRVLHTPLFK